MVARNEYLSELEARFVHEWCINPDSIAKCAQRAGYSPDNLLAASAAGSRTFNRPKVQAAIKEFQDAAAQRLGITKDRILKELALIGFAPVTGMTKINSEGETEVVTALPGDPQEVTVTTTKGHKASKTIKISSVKLADKRAALVDIAKHLGMFTEKVEVTHKASLLDLIEQATAEEAKHSDSTSLDKESGTETDPEYQTD